MRTQAKAGVRHGKGYGKSPDQTYNGNIEIESYYNKKNIQKYASINTLLLFKSIIIFFSYFINFNICFI